MSHAVESVVSFRPAYLRNAVPEIDRRGKILTYLYNRTVEDKLLPAAMAHNLSLEAFAKTFDQPATIVIFANDDDKVEAAAYGTIFAIEGPDGNRRASVAYCAFRKFHRNTDLSEHYRECIRYWFAGYGLSVIYGTIEPENHAALRMARLVGFHEIGLCPNFYPGVADAVLCYIGKSDLGEK